MIINFDKRGSSDTYSKSQIDGFVATLSGDVESVESSKQDTLVSGTNIKTINNQSLLGEGNIDIQGGSGGTTYSAGTNIDITDNVISVTGITIPDVSNFVTSADVETQITGKNYVTSGDVETQITGKGYVTSGDIEDFVTSADVETQITNKNYVTSGDVETQITGKGYVTSGDVETQITGKNYVTSGDVQTQITSAMTNTVSSTTIHTIVSISQADYDLLPSKDPNTLYVIISS